MGVGDGRQWNRGAVGTGRGLGAREGGERWIKRSATLFFIRGLSRISEETAEHIRRC